MTLTLKTVKHFGFGSAKIRMRYAKDMVENTHKLPDAVPRFDPLIQTENIAFNRDELLTCKLCNRQNPPNRPQCIYCGEDLAIPVEAPSRIMPDLRRLEAWESGFNVILHEQISDIDTARVASLLSIEKDDLADIFHAGLGLPLARVESEKVAEALRSSLQNLGVRCLLVSDDDLDADTPPTRVSAVEFLDFQLAIKDFNTGRTTLIGCDEVALVVRGHISKTKIDSNERKRRRTADVKLIDEYATVSDESVIDIYTFADKTGFRFYPAGFDFSCLGDQKTLLARDNVGRLVNRLTEHCPKVRLVSNYPTMRLALGHVWEIESRKDSLGLRQIAIGKREFGSVASTSNLTQFTKFSRLQWHLL